MKLLQSFVLFLISMPLFAVELLISNPAEGFILKDEIGRVQLVGSVVFEPGDNPQGYLGKVTCGAKQATVHSSQHTWSIFPVDLPNEGENTLSCSYTWNGQTSTQEVTVFWVKPKGEVIITSPADGLILRDEVGRLNIEGRVQFGAGEVPHGNMGRVVCNGKDAAVIASSNYSWKIHNLQLSGEGPHVINCSYDRNGHTSIQSLSVQWLKPTGELFVSTPTNGQIIRDAQGRVDIEGYIQFGVDDIPSGNFGKVICGDKQGSVKASDRTWKITNYRIPTEGAHTISCSYTRNDRTSTKAINVIWSISNQAPVIGESQILVSPEDNVYGFNLNGATDVDSPVLTYQLVSAPSNGSLAGCADGSSSTSCIFTPDANFNGVVNFSYRASDGQLFSEVAEVTLNITPVNDVPVIGENQSFSINEDSAFNFLLNSAGDVDGDSLTYRLVSPPEVGFLFGCLDGTASLSCLYIPPANFNGNVSFTYVVSDGLVDSISTAQVSISVTPINDAPTIGADQSLASLEDVTIEFQLNSAQDQDGDALTYILVTAPASGVLTGCANGAGSTACTYVPGPNFHGEVSFTYKAFDGQAESAVATVTIEIASVNDAPVLGEDQTLAVDEDEVLSFALNEAIDADGDDVFYQIVGSPTVGTLTDCGDDSTNTGCTYTPPTNFNGVVSFTYKARDAEADSASIGTVSISVNAINDLPLPGADQTLAMNEDEELSFELSAGSDIDGNNLTYRLIDPPQNGTLVGCANSTNTRSCQFVPEPNFFGEVVFSYVVNDGIADSSSQATVVITIAPVNDAPIAGLDQSLDGIEDTPLSFFLNSATDADGDLLTYELVDSPSNGVLSNCLGGTANIWCTFYPETNFNGVVSFSYRATDGVLFSEVVQVSINFAAVNDSPVMPGSLAFQTNEDTAIILNLSPGSDVEGNSLVYSLSSAVTGGALENCLGGTDDLICDFIPTANFNGQASFSYKANDGTSDSLISTQVVINVLPVNDVPVPSADQTLAMDENTVLDFDVLPGTDADGTALTYKVIIPPANGSLTGCLENNTDLSCSYTPNTNFSGDEIIRYRIFDGTVAGAKLGTITVNVRMVNAAPLVAGNVIHDIDEDVRFDFTAPSASDVNGDSLTYSVVQPPTIGSLTGCLENNNDLTCTYNPAENFSGLVTFTFKANDGRVDSEGVTEITFNIRPINDAPVAGANQELALNQDAALKFSLSQGLDIDGDALTYALVAAPQHGQIVGCLDGSGSTNCEYIPQGSFVGSDTLTYKVSDGVLESVNTATVSFTVARVNNAPVLSGVAIFETNEDVALSINLPAAVDPNSDPLKYWIGVTPANGKLESCLNGTTDLSCVFTPSKDFNGEVQFSYFAHDGVLESEKLQVRVNVLPVNDPPMLGANQEFELNEDETFSFTVNQASDVDSESSLIGYSIVTQPSHGQIVGCMNGTSDLSCEYIPEKDFFGEVSFTYTASDGVSSSAELAIVTLQVLPINEAPFFNRRQLAEVIASQVSELIIQGAIDSDGDNLTYELVTPPENATLDNCLNGSSDLVCDFSFASGYTGEVSFEIRAFDGQLYSEVQEISVASISLPNAYPVAVEGGASHFCSILSDGSLVCWGTNARGQLGVGHTDNIGDNELPIASGVVNVGAKVKKVALGNLHTCALTEDGQVKCWGTNSNLELGFEPSGTVFSDPASLAFINLGMPAIDVAAGNSHTCVILESKDINCWGQNFNGQVGALSSSAAVPFVSGRTIRVGGPVKQLALGAFHSCALLESGQVRCWGENHAGALGIGRAAKIGDDEHPESVETVELGEIAVSIDAGPEGVCAVLESGAMRCWGRNIAGELGYGFLGRVGLSNLPLAIPPINVGFSVESIKIHSFSACALGKNSELKCWGDGRYGIFATGAIEGTIGDNESPSALGNISIGAKPLSIAITGFSACSLLENNSVKCWGRNNVGQLGLGHIHNIGDDELLINSPNTIDVPNISNAVISEIDDSLRAPVTIVFDGTNSTPSATGTSITDYEWDFDEGGTLSGSSVTKTFLEGGNFQVRLRVTDNTGSVGVAYKQISIANEFGPQSVISASGFSGNASYRVVFDGLLSQPSEPGQSIVGYDWVFGDGSSASGMLTEHTFINPGAYTVSLTVTDSLGKTSTSQRLVAVFNSLAPIANFEFSPESPRAPTGITFDASGSSPGSFDGSIVRYEWDFGDQQTSEGQIVNHAYATGKTYRVALRVTDDRGKVGNKIFNILVLPELFPVARITQSVNSGIRPLNVIFDGSTSSPAEETGEVVSYSWLVDGQEVGQGETLSYIFEDQRVYVIGLRVTDNLGKTHFAESQVEVLPQTPPTASLVVTQETQYPHVPVDITLDASASIPGNGGGSITNYEWDLGDGTTKIGSAISHRYEKPGAYAIKLKVTNELDESAVYILSKTYYDSLLVNLETDIPAVFAGDSIKFKKIVRNHLGEEVNYPVSWISSDPSILQVSTQGSVTGIGSGEAYIQAKVGNNLSSPLHVVVKERTVDPQILIGNDYFAKSYEEVFRGGSFQPGSYRYISSPSTTIATALIDNFGKFEIGAPLSSGVNNLSLKAFTGNTQMGQSIVPVKFLDGHGKSLRFDGLDDHAKLTIGAGDIASVKFGLGLWVRLDETSVAGEILKLSNDNGKGIKLEFDYKKEPVLVVDSILDPIYLAGSRLKLQEWTHFYLSIDAEEKKLKFYQNGLLVAEKQYHSDLGWNGTDLSGELGGSSFKGLIDELVVFNLLLNKAQLSSLILTNTIAGIQPKARFGFDGVDSQRYRGSAVSTLVLGSGSGYDDSDPDTRFASKKLTTKEVTFARGAVLVPDAIFANEGSLNRISLEFPPEAIANDVNVTLELLDASTTGYVPNAFSGKGYLVRVHPINGGKLARPAVLTLPIDSEMIERHGDIHLYEYKKISGEIRRKTPVTINLIDQTATFKIDTFGTYFSAYDSSVYPIIAYSDDWISDDPLRFGDFDRLLNGVISNSGQGPYDLVIEGESDNSLLTDHYCSFGNFTPTEEGFPFVLTAIGSARTQCYLSFKKSIDTKNYFVIKHYLNIEFRN